MTPTVFVLTDALRWDYFEPEVMPFLSSIAKEGVHVKRIQPNFGFCEISEYITGARPEVTGNFTALTYEKNPKDREFPSWIRFTATAERIRPKWKLTFRHWARLSLEKTGHHHPTYEIPWEILPSIVPTEGRRLYTEPGSFPVESLFQPLAEKGMTFYDHTFVRFNKSVGNDDYRASTLAANAKSGHDFYLAYLGEGDHFGHLHGPRSQEVLAVARRQDERLEEIYRAFERERGDFNFMVVADHGMVRVDQTIDAQASIRQAARRHGLKFGRDYAYFLDSTMVRLWYLRPKAMPAFDTLFAQEPFKSKGEVLTDDLARERKVPRPGGSYGDAIWLAHPGVLVYPDFFNAVQYKGMHGYRTDIPEQQGFAVIASTARQFTPSVVEHGELTDVCPTLCDLMGLRYPNGNQGRSLLR